MPRKRLYIDRCLDCMYFNRETMRCWHSLGKEVDIDRAKYINTIPDWCPLEDADDGEDT